MAEPKTNIPENTWKCSNCGNTLVAITPPETLPGLHSKMRFSECHLL